MAGKVVEFLRKKDFEFKQELGQGACGRTVLLYDAVIDESFVCKKYSPVYDSLREELFKNFVREIKLLHLVNHPNVVRVFNYYLYPEQLLGYILMEYVQGTDIEDYIASRPEDLNEVFIQVIDGFNHLEKHNILHRDIRPHNLLVGDNGTVKIIDFGFGKRTNAPADFDKSITLNWWCDPPQEFNQSVYDYQTEIYFLGKLFQKIIVEHGLAHFKYKNLLARMCAFEPQNRCSSFSEIRREILSEKFEDIEFEHSELHAYRTFSTALHSALSKIEKSTKYYDDILDIQSRLEECYKKVMLEENIPSSPTLLKCFINGSYYSMRRPISVQTLKSFVELLRACSREKKNIILSNIQSRLDSIPRYEDSDEDDIPF